MYGFYLEAGQTLVLDVDAGGSGDAGVEGSLMDSILRIFDSQGNEVAIVENAAAPDEIFQANGDTYIEFIAPETGTYYAGISNLGNNFYDPNVAGSGSGWTFPGAFEPGPYLLNATLLSGDGGGEPDIIGTDDAETLEGDSENNSIDALGGDDLVAGLLGDDTVFGGSGDDLLRGDANSRSPGGSVGGDDVISGGAGNDRIGGKGGNDLLFGDAGDDEIFGDAGDDTIMGVTGDDTLTGDDFSDGSGSDLFVFGSGDGTDLITDFDVTEDMIGLVEGELTFEELSITNSDAGAMISVIESGETLAVLQGINADELAPELFMVTPDISLV
jgi:Ca2+-binding RTX toxin-like protein